jgi:hypothetical protein
MATIQITTQTITTDLQGDVTTTDTDSTAVTVTEIAKRDFSLTNGSTAIVWEAAANANPATFEKLVIISSHDLTCAMVADVNATYGTEQAAFTIEANVPFLLGNDTTIVNYGSSDPLGTGVGDSDKFEKISVKNSSGSTATITVIMGL